MPQVQHTCMGSMWRHMHKRYAMHMNETTVTHERTEPRARVWTSQPTQRSENARHASLFCMHARRLFVARGSRACAVNGIRTSRQGAHRPWVRGCIATQPQAIKFAHACTHVYTHAHGM